MVCRDLRQQQAACATMLDHEPMPADFNLVDHADGTFWREQRDFDVNEWELARRDGREPRIGVGDGAAEVHKGAAKRRVRRQAAETAAQRLTMVNRDKRAAAETERTDAH